MMGAIQWIALLSTFFLASLSVLAAITARSALRELRRRLAQRSTRSLRELDSAVASLESSLASNTTTLRRLTSRIGMQDMRARRNEESAPEPPNMTPAERKVWLKTQLNKGKLTVVRDNPGATG